jgi:hypothetical protein
MPNNVDAALRSAVRALDEVITPAVDRANPLAEEQVRLVRQLLAFLEGRVQYVLAKDVRELSIYVDTARRLATAAAEVDPVTASQLAQAAKDGSAALVARPLPDSTDVSAVSARLASLISRLVRFGADQPAGLQVEAEVVRGSKAILDLHRAWFAPGGFEPNPADAPDLRTELARLVPANEYNTEVEGSR